MRIVRWDNGKTIIDREVSSIRELVELAIKEGISLAYSDLQGADLRFSNLRYSDLQYSNLRYSDLQYSDLQYSDLRYSDLQGADLRFSTLQYSNLRYSDLQGATLQYSNLQDSNLQGASLFCSIGNGIEIITIVMEKYHVCMTKDIIQIGCENRTKEEWKSLSDKEIDELDTGALVWWNKYKDFIFMTISLSFETKRSLKA